MNAADSIFSKHNVYIGSLLIVVGFFICLPRNDYSEPANIPVNNVVKKVDATIVLTPSQIKKVLLGNN